ncbi:SusD/RagB family nutrient-binding outer membrane lipoprotein [Rapidithrix thailandica]|uniref:SusD/RagB family nutrient-binding outer membrane lipoprotein n=1 Tax=Rapidithrix thailandica TaxID=413964 RepID=A0AAW9RVM4_9BACT
MKFLYKYICLGLLMGGLGACESNFEEINTNPNKPDKIAPEFILSDVLVRTAYLYQSDSYMGKLASVNRYITLTRNEADDLFHWTGNSWSGQYEILANNKNLYDLSSELEMKHCQAISLIIKSFLFSYTSDLFGDIPYSKALLSKEENIIYPSYDTQEEVYQGVLSDLKTANELLSSEGFIDEEMDVIYQGDAMKWRKFANSLRLRLLLRVSNKLNDAFAKIQEIANDPSTYPIFESNEDNANLEYLGLITDNMWPGGENRLEVWDFEKRRPSQVLIRHLLERNDPRMKVWFNPVKADPASGISDQNEYVGVPHAIPAPYEYNGGGDNQSLLADIYRKNNHPMVQAMMMNYTEVLFILAETVQKGNVTVSGETAESLYYKAIGASMEQYEVMQEAEDQAYNDQELVKYDNSLEQLITQKWLALWLTGGEAWFNFRRTGFPVFPIGPRAVQKVIPSRMIYPTEEAATNEVNYEQAIVQQGWAEDGINEKIWYLQD